MTQSAPSLTAALDALSTIDLCNFFGVVVNRARSLAVSSEDEEIARLGAWAAEACGPSFGLLAVAVAADRSSAGHLSAAQEFVRCELWRREPLAMLTGAMISGDARRFKSWIWACRSYLIAVQGFLSVRASEAKCHQLTALLTERARAATNDEAHGAHITARLKRLGQGLPHPRAVAQWAQIAGCLKTIDARVVERAVQLAERDGLRSEARRIQAQEGIRRSTIKASLTVNQQITLLRQQLRALIGMQGQRAAEQELNSLHARLHQTQRMGVSSSAEAILALASRLG